MFIFPICSGHYGKKTAAKIPKLGTNLFSHYFNGKYHIRYFQLKTKKCYFLPTRISINLIWFVKLLTLRKNISLQRVWTQYSLVVFPTYSPIGRYYEEAREKWIKKQVEDNRILNGRLLLWRCHVRITHHSKCHIYFKMLIYYTWENIYCGSDGRTHFFAAPYTHIHTYIPADLSLFLVPLSNHWYGGQTSLLWICGAWYEKKYTY